METAGRQYLYLSMRMTKPSGTLERDVKLVNEKLKEVLRTECVHAFRPDVAPPMMPAFALGSGFSRLVFLAVALRSRPASRM